MLFFKIKDKEKKIESHLLDIRKHIFFALIIFIIGFITTFFFSQYIYCFLKTPLINTLKHYNYSQDPFIVTSLTEGFFSYLKISFYSVIFFLLPLFIWQILLYLLPIFESKIKKELIILGCLAPICFYMGFIFAYVSMFYVVWNFLVGFNLSKDLSLYLKISEYINLALSITTWVGICFELPVILYILFRVNLVNYYTLKKFRKIAIVLSFAVAAILTPPDPGSQIILALVLILLYEISMFFIKIQYNKLSKSK